ncbi:MAG: VOC family protein [Thermomicrobiales bacterium]
MIKGIDHIEIVVRDADAYIAFMETLGFEVITRTVHHGGSAELKLPGDNQPIFEIHQVEGEENPGINHIAFAVDDARMAYEDLIGAGVASAKQPNYVQSTGRLTVNLRDPDGFASSSSTPSARNPERPVAFRPARPAVWRDAHRSASDTFLRLGRLYRQASLALNRSGRSVRIASTPRLARWAISAGSSTVQQEISDSVPEQGY